MVRLTTALLLDEQLGIVFLILLYVGIVLLTSTCSFQVQDRPKTAQDRPKTAQDRPKTAQDRPKTAQDSPMLLQPVHRAYTFYTSTIGWAVCDLEGVYAV